MTLRNTLIAASIVFASAGAAFADDEKCTEANIGQKTQEMALAMQKIGQADPTRLQEISVEMQETATAAQTSGDITELCALYDALIEEAKQ